MKKLFLDWFKKNVYNLNRYICDLLKECIQIKSGVFQCNIIFSIDTGKPFFGLAVVYNFFRQNNILPCLF